MTFFEIPRQNPLYLLKFFLLRCVSVGYTPRMKDSGFRIRIDRELRDRFVEICREQDRPAAQVIREFMRQHIAKAEAEKEHRGTDGTRRRN